MTDFKKLLHAYETEIRLGLEHLSYSIQKVSKLPTFNSKENDAELLESWESLAARFARVSDIFMSKFIRTRVLSADPAFRGELRDFIDQGEKIGLISSADKWMEIRELRNKIAHEYTQESLAELFADLLKASPFIVSELKRLFP